MIASEQPKSLLTAAWEGDLELVEALLAIGADTEIHNDKGIRPIHAASYRGYIKIVVQLLAYGADPIAQTDEGYVPLFLALNQGHMEVADFIFQKLVVPAAGSSVADLFDAALNSSSHASSAKKVDCALWVVRNLGAPLARLSSGLSPLISAIMTANSSRLVSALLAGGEDPDELARIIHEGLTGMGQATDSM